MRIQRRGQAIRIGTIITVKSHPFTIGIGGSHSGVGKTTVAVELLKHLTKIANVPVNSDSVGKEKLTLKTYTDTDTKKSWGAIKYTRTAIYSSIIDDLSILRQGNKDTERLLNAGAENVLWVQSPDEGLKEVMHLAVSRLSHLGGIIIEGNSAIEFLKPDVVIFILGKDSETLKKSAVKVLNMADIILFQQEPAIKLPVRAKKFKVSISPVSGLDECINYINGMTRQGDFRMKDSVEEKVKKRAVKGKLPCPVARMIAENLGVSYETVGRAADKLNVKITNCPLGCF